MKFGKQLAWEDAKSKRRRLLAEFLQTKAARRAANAQLQETTSENQQTEFQNHQIMKVPHDLLFKIFILLPAESLFMLQFVCKKWFSLINSSAFIRDHSQQSEIVLISQNLTLSGPENNPKSYFHFLDLDQGNHNFIESNVVVLVDVLASCDGLVLATVENKKSLILMNPLTRKHKKLPLGTATDFGFELYGVAFCNDLNHYKVVHLFYEEQGCSGCEILSISAARKWTRMEGPSSELLRYIRRINPVFVGGSLFWISKKHYFISICVESEKFITKSLPAMSSNTKDSRLMEIEGSLGFLSYDEDDNKLQVWILMSDGGLEENWVKSYSIDVNACVVPICSLRNGKEMVLESSRHRLYVCEFDSGKMKLVHSGDQDIELWYQRIEKLYIPHRNTLVSWEDHHEILC
ncbi:hypothetical protein CDL12_25244 [Handroanthus impetiginosus]|uniref:F-box domain-containing protein n=1 Tax=Handroanthus impetiginosus TaxID=429701 RepID=A0A2G9GAD0_9LAMI|nr:hypothetical protein CDL12_25244 [Handroanthus impetiginosus]